MKKLPLKKRHPNKKQQVKKQPKKPYFFKDILWKAILSDLLFEFIQLCHRKLFRLVDTTKPAVFLDKEFPKLFPASKGKGRYADIIVKVFLKTGEEMPLIIHIEAQGYPDAAFAKRMDSYSYRAFEKYQIPVESIALFTDNDKNFRPDRFYFKAVVSERSFKYHTIKLLDFDPKKLRRKRNIFAIVLEAAWYGLQKNQLNDNDLMEVGMDLLRRLARKKVPRGKIMALLSFIKAIVRFEKPDNTAIFETHLNNFDNQFDMGILDQATQEMPRTFQALLEMQRAAEQDNFQLKEKLKKSLAEAKKSKLERLQAEEKARQEMQERLQAEEKARQEMQERLQAEEKARLIEQKNHLAITLLFKQGISPSSIASSFGIPETEVLKILNEGN